mmetsp:Transcript_29840/g.75039  ORF Transcript_29840/g.75039 Transcript_29840/m.75039 type:complete len:260 (+) Transcript_29840:358-1137(+)
MVPPWSTNTTATSTPCLPGLLILEGPVVRPWLRVVQNGEQGRVGGPQRGPKHDILPEREGLVVLQQVEPGYAVGLVCVEVGAAAEDQAPQLEQVAREGYGQGVQQVVDGQRRLHNGVTAKSMVVVILRRWRAWAQGARIEMPARARFCVGGGVGHPREERVGRAPLVGRHGGRHTRQVQRGRRIPPGFQGEPPGVGGAVGQGELQVGGFRIGKPDNLPEDALAVTQPRNPDAEKGSTRQMAQLPAVDVDEVGQKLLLPG